MRRACRRSPIQPFPFSLDYPGGRADIWLALLGAPQRDLSPARAALAQRLVAERARHPADGISLARDPQGAPYIAAPDLRLEISLAGRDDIVAAAVADGPVGVDVEPIGPAFEPPLNVLHPAERVALAAAGEDAHDLFLAIWTAKEAYVKALGVGLSREPAEIEVRPAGATEFHAAQDLRIFDRERAVGAAAARVGRVRVLHRPVMLACIILPACDGE